MRTIFRGQPSQLPLLAIRALLHGWVAVVLLAIGALSPLVAGDWPQILGPNRNGIAVEEKLAAKWPAGGPPVVWERAVGTGYAGLAVEGNRAILFHRERDQEWTECLAADTGQTLWKQGHPTTFYPQVGGMDGPLCVPTITGEKVITFGAQGVLSCFSLTDGQLLWQRKTHEEFNAQEGYFGAGSSPVVTAGLVIANVGGRREAGIVAFDLQTGETRWSKTDEPASYAAPVPLTLEGIPHVLMVTRYQCLCLEAESGAIRFQFPFGQRGPTVNAAAPLVIDGNQLFVTASYGIGSVYAKFNFLNFEVVWEGERGLASQYCTPIHLNGTLVCLDGREDIPPADLKAIELKSGKLLWQEQGFGYGNLIAADDKLLILKTTGELILGRSTPDGFQKLGQHKALGGECRALPALSNGRLFIRDAKKLKCFQVN